MTETDDLIIGSSAARSTAPPAIDTSTQAAPRVSSASAPGTAAPPVSITMAPPTALTSSARGASTSTSNPINAATPGAQDAISDPYRFGMPFDRTPVTMREERSTRQGENVVATEQPTQPETPPMGDLENMLRTILDHMSESRRQSTREERSVEPVTQQLRRNLFIEVPTRPQHESAAQQSPGDQQIQRNTIRNQHSPNVQHPYLGFASPQRPSLGTAPSHPGATFPHNHTSPQQHYQQPISPNLNMVRPQQPLDINARQTAFQEPWIARPTKTAYDLERDREIAAIKDQMREMTSQVHQAIRAAPEVDRVLRETLSTPFTTAITDFPLRNIGKMTIPTYEGTTDPSQHLQTFTIAMGRARFTPGERDAGYCQLFVENLRGEALRWFTRLETNSISSFHQLSTAFLQHYLLFIQKEVSTADLWSMTQEPKESLRKFIERFKQVASRITIPDDAGIMALQKALLYAPSYRRDLWVNKPQTLEDALHRAATFIELEEEEARVAIRIQAATPTPKPSPTKDKAIDTSNEPRQHIGRDYLGNRPPNVRRPPTAFAVNDRSPTKPAWNKYVRDGAKAGESFCDYHKIPGHATHECRSLQQLLLQKFQRGEIDDLNMETHLDDGAQQIFANQDRQTEPRQNNSNAQQKRTRETDEDNHPPRPKKLIN